MKRRRPDRIVAILFRSGLYRGLAMTGICMAIAGCSRGPSALPKTTVDPAAASTAAFELYDSDGDGQLTAAELEKAAEIKAGLKNLDLNSDGNVTDDELRARIEIWNGSQYSILPISCGVTLDGAPLEGANVTFEPPPFLKEALRVGVGVTNSVGSAAVSIPKENRLVADSPPGLQMGYYIVRISKVVDGKELIPAKYNTESILGQEVAYDDPGYQSQIIFNLSTK